MGTAVLVVTCAFAALFLLIVVVSAIKSSQEPKGSRPRDVGGDHGPVSREVATELESLRRIGGGPAQPSFEPDDLSQGPFGRAKAFLKIQLFSKQSRGAFESLDRDSVVSRTLCEGLWACMVWDFGHSEVTVSREQFESMVSRSGRSEEELWELALDNLLGQEIGGEELTLGEAGEVGYLYMGNGAFVTSLAQRWERLQPDLPQDRGVLLSVPNWHALLLLPVGDQVRAGLPKYLELLGGLFDYDDPVSGDVFWVREGTWTRLERSAEGLVFPEELAALL